MGKSLLIVSPSYFPEASAPAKRVASIAEFLTERGWEVTVLTLLPHYPQRQIYKGYDVRTPYVRVENRITITRLRPWIVPGTSLVRRLMSETLFAVQAGLQIVKTRCSVVLASSPYMFLGPFALLASRLSGKKFIWDVRDLTWEYPRATGKLTYGFDTLLRRVMLKTARSGDCLITVTEGVLNYFGQKPAHYAVIPNGISDDLLDRLRNISQKMRDKNTAPRVLYAGLLGYNQRLSTLLGAAKLLPEVSFIVCGDGPERKVLEEGKRNLRLANVEFKGYVSQDQLTKEYEQADILYAQLVRHPIHRWSEPSKLWEYMAAGRPIIYGGIGSMAELIREHALGVVIPPEDSEALAQAIRELLARPDHALRLGEAGRRYVEKYRRRSVVLANLENILEETLACSGSSQNGKGCLQRTHSQVDGTYRAPHFPGQ